MTITTNGSRTSSVAPEAQAGGFTVGYRQLSEALRTIAVAAKSTSLPVLQQVLVDVYRGRARLTTFDFDTAVTVELAGARDCTKGRMLIEHAAFARVLAAAVKGGTKRHLDQLEVRVDVVDGAPTVRVDGYAVPLEAKLSPDRFPALPRTTPATHVLDRAAFTGLFERCRRAADRGDTLPILTAVRLELAVDGVVATATDRYRLATGSVPARGTTSETVLAPAETVAAVLGRLDGDELAVGTDLIGESVWLTVQAGVVTARILTINGAYPSVASTLSSAGGPLTVTVPRAALAAAAAKAAAITAATADKTTAARVVVGPETVTVEPGSGGGRACSAPALAARVGLFGEAWVAGVNPVFFVEAVTSVDADEVTLHLGDPARPLVLTAAGEPNGSAAAFRHVLMPVRFAR